MKRSLDLVLILRICFLLSLLIFPISVTGQNKESCIFIPAEEWKSILQLEKEGITLTFGEYKELYKKALSGYKHQKVLGYNIPPKIVQSTFVGKLKKDFIEINLNYHIVQTLEEPKTLDFPINPHLLLRKILLNKTTPLLTETPNKIQVTIPKAGTYLLSIEGYIPLKPNLKNKLKLYIPSSPFGNIQIQTPIYYDIKFPNLTHVFQEEKKDQRIFYAFCGDQSSISIEAIQSYSSEKLETFLKSTEAHSYYIRKDFVEINNTYHIETQNREITSLEFCVPKGVEISSIYGPGISGWTESIGTEKKTLHIDFSVPGHNTFINLNACQYIMPNEPFILNDIYPNHSFTRTGNLSLYFDKNIRIKAVKKEHVLLPAFQASSEAIVSNNTKLYQHYRLCNLPYQIHIKMKDAPSTTTAIQHSQLTLTDTRSELNFRISIKNISNATSYFHFTLPEDYFLKNVTAQKNGKLTPIQKSSLQKDQCEITFLELATPDDTLLINFVLEKHFNPPLTTQSSPIEIPFISCLECVQTEGTQEIIYDDNFLLEDIQMPGYIPLDSPLTATSKKILTYHFSRMPEKGMITLKVKNPELNTETANYLTIDQDLIQVTTFLHYQIQNGTADSFYFGVPGKNLRINIEGPGIKEKKKISTEIFKNTLPESELERLKDYEIWNILLQTKIDTPVIFTIDYQLKVGENSYQQIPIPEPLFVQNDTGYLIIESSKNTEILLKHNNLETIETFELPKWPHYQPSRRIIESLKYFSRPFVFELKVNKREEIAVLAALIQKQKQTYILTSDLTQFFEYQCHIQNTNQQFMEITLPNNCSLWSVAVDEHGVKPRKKNDSIQIPLPFKDYIEVKLTGTIASKNKSSFLQITPQTVKPDMPVLATETEYYLPPQYSVLTLNGNFENTPVISKSPILINLFRTLILRFKSFPAKNSRLRVEETMQKKAFDSLPSRVKAAPHKPEQKKEAINQIKNRSFKKGLISMPITLPKEGKILFLKKEGENLHFKLFLISQASLQTVRILLFFLFLFIGWGLLNKNLISPFLWSLSQIAFWTVIPFFFLKELTPVYNVLLGSALSATLIHQLSKRFHFLKIILLATIALTFQIRIQADEKNPMTVPIKQFPTVSLYIPYELPLSKIISNDKKVFIPTQDYFALKFLAEPPWKPQPQPYPKTSSYSLITMELTGENQKDTIHYKATIDFYVYQEDWVVIDLPFRNIHYEKALLDGFKTPVKVLKNDLQENYQIPVIGKGFHQLHFDFQTQIITNRGELSIDFVTPLIFCSHHTLILNDPTINIVKEQPEIIIEKKQTGYCVKHSLATQNRICLKWSSSTKTKEEISPLIYSHNHASLYLNYDNNYLLQAIKTTVEKSPVSILSYLVPPRLKVLKIESPHILKWELQKKSDDTILNIILSQPTKGEIQHTIHATLPVETPLAPFSLPFISPLNTERTEGNYTFLIPKYFALDVQTPSNLLIQAHSSKPETPTDKAYLQSNPESYEIHKNYSFHLPNINATLHLSMKKPYITAFQKSHFEVTDTRIVWTLETTFDIREGILSQIKYFSPKGWEIEEYRGEFLSAPIISKVDNIMEFALTHPQSDKYTMIIRCTRQRHKHTPVEIPSMRLDEITAIKGSIGIAFPNGYEISEIQKQNVYSTSPREIKLPYSDYSLSIPQYAYEYSEPGYGLSYRMLKKEASINSIKIHFLKAEDNLVKESLLCIFQIKHAPLNEFVIHIPKSLKDFITIQSESIKTILKKDIPDSEYSEIIVQTQKPYSDSYLMEINYHVFLDQSKTFILPSIRFPKTNSIMEYIALETATAYQIESIPSAGLREIEKEQIPAFPQNVDIQKVYWTYSSNQKEPLNYQVKIKRFEREKLIEAKILREGIVSYIDPSGLLKNQVSLKMRNRTLQFLPIKFPKDSQIWSVLIGNESVRPSRENRNDQVLFIPLIKSETKDRNFDIQIIYTNIIPSWNNSGKIALPVIQISDKIPVEKTVWKVFVPKKYKLWNWKHNLTSVTEAFIEAGNTLDLAKEYAYWTEVAQAATGELKENAMKNRNLVLNEYQQKEGMIRNRPPQIIQNNKQTKSLEQSNGILKQAESLINLNQKLPPVPSKKKGKINTKNALVGRKSLQGWQFKTEPLGQNEVETSISNLIQQKEQTEERTQQIFERQKILVPIPFKEQRKGECDYDSFGDKENSDLTRKDIMAADEKQDKSAIEQEPQGEGLECIEKEIGFLSGKEEKQLVAAGVIHGDLGQSKIGTDSSSNFNDVGDVYSNDFEQKPLSTVPQQSQILRQSTLLHGMRSMKINLPESDNSYLFQKLGTSPELSFSYTHKNIITKTLGAFCIFILFLISFRFRKRKMPPFFFSLPKTFKPFLKILTIIPVILIFSSFFFSFEAAIKIFLFGWGYNMIILLNLFSSIRYRKKGYIPPFHSKIFYKYLLSYLTVLTSCLTFIDEIFFIHYTCIILFNSLWVMVYGVLTWKTRPIN